LLSELFVNWQPTAVAAAAYQSLYISHQILPDVFSGDDAANQRRRAKSAGEEDTFDVVAVAVELCRVYKVLYDVRQYRSRQVFSLEIAYGKKTYLGKTSEDRKSVRVLCGRLLQDMSFCHFS